jgi:NAD-dependent deacetylase
MTPIDLREFKHVVFFTGAGMSAESGVPTYRGHGGIWHQYRYEEYACQRAFVRDPVKVLDFHELRRTSVLACQPHAGHTHIARLQAALPILEVITQNIDGMFQRAGVRVAAELHGSMWRVRCATHGVTPDEGQGAFRHRRCPQCNAWLRPDITWFEDNVDADVFARAGELVTRADLFVSIGTSGAVWPAAGFAQQARRSGARMVEINPEDNEASSPYETQIRAAASAAIPALFPL